MNPAANRLVIGAIGPPGKRTFYAQVSIGGDPSWIVIEKFQAAVFAVQARELLDSVGHAEAGAGLDPASLDPPGRVLFRAGAIELRYQPASEVIEVEFVPTQAEETEALRFTVTPAQLDAAAGEAATAVEGGRPRCPQCGLAMDPDGHPCPAHNGDLRHHQA